MSSTRGRATAANLPRPPVNLDPQCIISDSAVLFGKHPVTIGAHAVLHPRSRLNSTYAPVTIGEGCIISERCNVGLQDEPDGSPIEPRVELEANVSVEPGATVEATRVGEGSVIEAGSILQAGAVLGKNCRVTPLCEVNANQTLPDFTVVFGNNDTRKEKPGLETYRAATHQKQLEVLKRLVPSNLAKWQQPDG